MEEERRAVDSRSRSPLQAVGAGEAAFLRKGQEWSVSLSHRPGGRVCCPTLQCPGQEHFSQRRGEEASGLGHTAFLSVLFAK